MGLTIRDTLRIEELKGLRVVASKKSLDREIRWIHICDTASMTEGLKGGELLLTYAHWIKNDRDKQEYLIKQLVAKQVSGLAIEPGCYFETIPQHMIKLADKLGLPLLEIPSGTPFISLTEVLMGRIVKNNSFEKLLNEASEIYGFEFRSGTSTLLSLDKEERLFEEVKYGNEEQVFSLLKEIFVDVLNSGLKKELIQTRCLELAIMLSRVAVKGGVNLETALHLNRELITRMNVTNNLKEKFKLTKDFVKKYIDLIHKKKNIDNLEIIQKVKEFIWRNYSDKLTLRQIADQVHLSSSYLSKIFKNTTGITIMDYVMEVRLRKAKKLIKDRSKTLNEVAKLTGYYDASYLSKIFKREVGITPGQYRANTQKCI